MTPGPKRISPPADFSASSIVGRPTAWMTISSANRLRIAIYYDTIPAEALPMREWLYVLFPTVLTASGTARPADDLAWGLFH
jgi:hypothetical protein